MKNTKIVALVAAVALLVIGAAFTSFAAQYNWYEQDGEWRCKDKNGEDYTEAWAKSGADWYWLNDEGFMARETLVDDDTKYVDADGKMVTNDWKEIEDEEGNAYWYYFQAGGKKLVGKEKVKPVTVNGKKYIFNDAGQMKTGWVRENYEDTDQSDEDEGWRDGIWYCGDDGAVTYGWRQIEVIDSTADFLDNNYWFYFGSDGKKIEAKEDAVYAKKSINGKSYVFDADGVMKSEWQAVYNTAATASNLIDSYAWYQSAEIGAKFAKGWFRVIPQGNVDPDNNYEETAKWFYAKSGQLYANNIKSIGGKKYGFNAAGEMVTGLCAVNFAADGEFQSFAAVGIDDALVLGTYTVPGASARLYYFSDDEDNDGSMKLGSQKITVDGDEYDFYFSKKNGKKGQGVDGKEGSKYYVNGKKIAADDAVAEYQLLGIDPEASDYLTFVDPKSQDGFSTVDYALISKTGTVIKSTSKKDGNGYKFVYNKKDAEHDDPYWTYEVEE